MQSILHDFPALECNPSRGPHKKSKSWYFTCRHNSRCHCRCRSRRRCCCCCCCFWIHSRTGCEGMHLPARATGPCEKRSVGNLRPKLLERRVNKKGLGSIRMAVCFWVRGLKQSRGRSLHTSLQFRYFPRYTAYATKHAGAGEANGPPTLWAFPFVSPIRERQNVKLSGTWTGHQP